ncbi:MAG: hypothetical protein EU533_07865 [Promethearchaeota archaeon]|nr:MAG: hypothetical protein EU533_07865 [Candidatus Lokiarchaeota archaeon]
MIFESIFMIRGAGFGQDFGPKLIMSIVGLLICVYDWKSNEKRKDYFWVFLFGAIIWSMAELMLQLSGMRALQDKYLFGMDITHALWLTIPLQGMSEGAFVAVIGLLFGDRILNKETQKKWSIIFILMLLGLFLNYLREGIHFNDVNAGDLSIPSRRDMFPLTANIFIIVMCALAILWLATTSSDSRKRGIMMDLIMIIFIACWTLSEWLTGQRWIEVGTVNSDGSYSNLRRAPPLIEFGALAYDVLIEVSLIYVPFLALPYWLGLIKTEESKV